MLSDYVQIRLDNIEKRKQEIGNKKHRKLQKYSDKFNEIFNFFLKSNRCGILTFCGYKVNVDFDVDGDDGKFGFRRYENGEIKLHNLKSRHPNILKSLIISKKGWGLWLDQWTDGIVECTFTKEEILKQFEENDIKIPDSFLLDFENTIIRKKNKRNKIELERLKKITNST